MKFVCSQSHLSNNLSLVSRAVSSRPTHPVLANVLVVVDEQTQQVKLSAFDLSLGIQTSFPASVETGGRLTLPAKLLNDIVSRLPDGELALSTEADEDAYLVTLLSSGSGRYQVRGMAADEFPELPAVEDGDALQLGAEALMEGLKGALFAASSDETKQVLTGVHLSTQDEGMEFAATDGHRLAVVSAEEGGDGGLDVTIPAKALQELTKMLSAQGEDSVSVRYDQAQVVFEWTDQRLTSRLLEGQYPNYRQLLPRSFARQMTVERRALSLALERIAVLADQRNNIVKMSLDAGKQSVELAVEAQDVGSGHETVPAQISGDDLEIAFNVKYLMDGLKAISTQDVQLQFNTATSPAILSPVGGSKLTYLVMPVQVRS
jgi:DNA polymerase III subunit beta